MARVLAASAVALTLTACTPQEVHEAYQLVGVDLTPHEADVISDWLASQDCLPWENLDQYVECAITDSWSRYLRSSGITIETWSRIAWCESKLNPEAVNRSSGAVGLYQHLPRYFPARAAAAGYSNDPLNARVNAMVSAWLYATSGPQHWRPSAACWN